MLKTPSKRLDNVMSKQPRQKKCKSCGVKFTPARPLQSTCSIPCAIDMARTIRARKERKDHREAKQKAKTRSQWLKEAQTVFNRWIRLRDEGKPCISCGTMNAKWDAGHYRSVGSNPALRFEPLNNHRQCAQCNQHKSGNSIEYRIGLVKRIGIESVEWLEGPHEPKHYTIDEIKVIKLKYATKIKNADFSLDE